MIVSKVTIVDHNLGFVKTKTDKNVLHFLENYSFRQGKVTEQNRDGYIAELVSANNPDDPSVIGEVLVTY